MARADRARPHACGDVRRGAAPCGSATSGLTPEPDRPIVPAGWCRRTPRGFPADLRRRDGPRPLLGLPGGAVRRALLRASDVGLHAARAQPELLVRVGRARPGRAVDGAALSARARAAPNVDSRARGGGARHHVRARGARAGGVPAHPVAQHGGATLSWLDACCAATCCTSTGR
jgi:hypothetical protein